MEDEIPLFQYHAGRASGKMLALINQIDMAVMIQRDEIVRAFVAKYGLEPEEAE